MSQSIRRRRTGVRPRWRSRPVPTAAGRSRVSARGVGVDGEVGGIDLDGGVVAGGGAGAGLGGSDLVSAGVVDEVDLTVGVAPQVDAGERLADGPPAEGLDPVVKPPEVAVVVEPRREVLVGCPGGGSVGGSSRNRWVIGPTPSQRSTPGQPPGSSLDLFPGRDGRGGGGSRRPRAELLNRLHRHTSSARTRHRQSRPTSRPWNRLSTNHLDISSCRPRPRPVATGAVVVHVDDNRNQDPLPRRRAPRRPQRPRRVDRHGLTRQPHRTTAVLDPQPALSIVQDRFSTPFGDW